ncbi:MAG TPA: carboxypeptidase-like regulatory domain-containing protein, partial [Solirubrobacteraceae bacterium]|nr:carboxypeptidase-like regulatory domain-containing protein [Solirubrobacteraceae bacterium]
MTWGLRGERHGLRGRCALALCGAIAVVLAGGAVARAAAYDIYYDSGKAEGSSGVRDIWRMNPDGTGQAEFLPGGELPSWSTSPAGALKMAYIDASGTDFTPASPHCEAGEPTGGAVYVVNQDATSPTFIDGSCGDAAISPDGTRVALANAVEGIDSVSVADPASITQVVAVPNQTACNMAENGVDDDAECGMGYRPAWNGAGTIDYLGDEDYWSLPSSGTSSDPTLVADGSSIGGYGADGMAVDPANGDLVVSAVETMSGGVGDSLYLIAPGGSTGTLIASPPAGHGYDWPAVSPDGTTVAFEDDVLSSDPAVSTIDTVPIGGGAVKDVTPTDTTAADPAFGPPAGNQTLSGTVTDAGGNAVANVTVLITGVPPTTGSSSATTNASGQFSASLPAGQYLVETAPPGQDGNTS